MIYFLILNEFFLICPQNSVFMKENRLMNQVAAVFGIFMTVFYIGIGIYIATTDDLALDKPVLVIFGVTFALYGVYRGFRSFQKIRDAFFRSDNNEE